jgi:propionyl-CoA carboxylase alpha chain
VTNRDFLVATLRHPAFLDGDTTTDFIDRHQPARSRVPSTEERRTAAVAAALWQQSRNRAAARVLTSFPTGWRNTIIPAQRFELVDGDVCYTPARDGSFAVQSGEEDAGGVARVISVDGDRIDVELDGRRVRAAVVADGDRVLVDLPTGQVRLERRPRFPGGGAEGPAGGLIAPMPGKVLEIRAEVGDAVSAGSVLIVMEAMKMEHHLSTPQDGTVASVNVTVGDQVDNGTVLLVVEPAG